MLKLIKSHIVTTVLVYGGAIILLCSALWLAFQYADPLPPNKIVIAAGSKTGAYYKFARQYAEYCTAQGLEVEILESNGSMDNLARMSEPNSGVDVAFMQGGITTPEEHPDLRSLGSLYYEPVWAFYSKKVSINKITDMEGMKIAIGPKGSGTNHVIKRILAENDLTPENTTFLEVGYENVLPKLVKGKIDVMFLVGGIRSKIIKTLSNPGNNVRLMSFERAEAYARSHHFLRRLTLPQGAINLADNLPKKDVSMLAPTANLVVNDDLHPAIKYLLLLAADKIQSKGDIFSQPGQFPNEQALLFPLSSEAESFYKKGPPLLMRYLPFQLAITLERLKILLIPLLTLLYPLFKVTPPAYRWQIRRRIFKWYKHLKKLDMEAYEITSRKEADKMLRQLERLDRKVMETSVPLSYTDYIYSLRIHIRMIQDRLEKVCCDTDTKA